MSRLSEGVRVRTTADWTFESGGRSPEHGVIETIARSVPGRTAPERSHQVRLDSDSPMNADGGELLVWFDPDCLESVPLSPEHLASARHMHSRGVSASVLAALFQTAEQDMVELVGSDTEDTATGIVMCHVPDGADS